ncbi:hypothetical protein [Oceanicoccus sagamiensis]|uniref:Uncharacterized protein n=1 Tax=Oceanicoccus sagamiensis TaxID=716816 RepID=A0A1X9N9W1_9GAMM|nr:hypothetical protein [Oceanicoccus sagamiensis]ARN73212.1 hypothetical protein BST96_03275 [Oceanicoccus sagamiensis]
MRKISEITVIKQAFVRPLLCFFLVLTPGVIADDDSISTKKWSPGTSPSLDQLFVTLFLDSSLALDLYGPEKSATGRRVALLTYTNFYTPKKNATVTNRKGSDYTVVPVDYLLPPVSKAAQLKTGSLLSEAPPSFLVDETFDFNIAGRRHTTPAVDTTLMGFLGNGSGDLERPLDAYRGASVVSLFRASMGAMGRFGSSGSPQNELITKEYRELPLAGGAFNYAMALGFMIMLRNKRCNRRFLGCQTDTPDTV